MQNPDYALYLQRARDAKPDALFAWVPGGLAAALMRKYAERGLNKSGIKLIGVGDITDYAVLNQASSCCWSSGPLVGLKGRMIMAEAAVQFLELWRQAYVYSEPRALEQLDETVAECIGAAAEVGIFADHLEKAAGESLKEYLRTAIINTSELCPRGCVGVRGESRERGPSGVGADQGNGSARRNDGVSGAESKVVPCEERLTGLIAASGPPPRSHPAQIVHSGFVRAWRIMYPSAGSAGTANLKVKMQRRGGTYCVSARPNMG